MQIKKFITLKKFRLFIYVVMCCVLVFSSQVNAVDNETLITVGNEPGFKYFTPELGYAPSGVLYLIYSAMDMSKGYGQIYLSKYEDGEVTFVKNVSESSVNSYWPDIEFTKNGDIHVLYASQRGGVASVHYRKFDGTEWSTPIQMVQLSNIEMFEDVRMGVDENGNMSGAFTHFRVPVDIKLISKYGTNVSVQNFPFVYGRCKHGETVVDNEKVHMVWQYYMDGKNLIAYSSRDNKAGAKWAPYTDIKMHGCQRPRITIGKADGSVQTLVALKDAQSLRQIFWKKYNPSIKNFDGGVEVSPLDRKESNNFSDFSSVNLDNILTAMQQGNSSRGKNVSYNWKQNGKWGGCNIINKTLQFQPTRLAVDLRIDHMQGAIILTDIDSGVYLVLLEPEASGKNPPSAAFTYSPHSGSIPLEVNFDASTSNDAGGSIVAYSWNFGDGNTGEGKTVKHTYTQEGVYTVELTVYDNENNSDKETGSLEAVKILPPLNVSYGIIQQRGFITWAYVGKVTWEDNPGNVTNDINVVKYNIYRKLAADANYTLFASVAKGTNLFYDQMGKEKKDYIYTVTAVDDEDRESNKPVPSPLPSAALMRPDNKKER